MFGRVSHVRAKRLSFFLNCNLIFKGFESFFSGDLSGGQVHTDFHAIWDFRFFSQDFFSVVIEVVVVVIESLSEWK